MIILLLRAHDFLFLKKKNSRYSTFIGLNESRREQTYPSLTKQRGNQIEGKKAGPSRGHPEGGDLSHLYSEFYSSMYINIVFSNYTFLLFIPFLFPWFGDFMAFCFYCFPSFHRSMSLCFRKKTKKQKSTNFNNSFIYGVHVLSRWSCFSRPVGFGCWFPVTILLNLILHWVDEA